MSKASLSTLLLLSLFAFGKAGLHQATAGELQAWEKRHKRLQAESIALFQAILEKRPKDNEGEPAPCELSSDWLDYAVPQGIVEKYFGLTIPADLSPSSTPGQPREILDPKGTVPEAFCTEKEDKEKLQPILDQFKKGELRDEQTGKTFKAVGNYRLEYSAPIFDRRYTRAVVVVRGRSSAWRVQPDGKIYHGSGEEIWASICVKRKGRWYFLRNESIARSKGGSLS
jgi:hypothetical protein